MSTVRKMSSPIASTVVYLSVLFLACADLTLRACSKFSRLELSLFHHANVQNDDSFAASLIISLSSPESAVRIDAEEKLISFARTSAARRQLIIRELLKSVGKQQELDGNHRVLKNSFLYWKSATNIFAELNALEAVDVLIRCVHCSNGWEGNMGEPPASYALVRLGKPILQRLFEALKVESDAYKRMKIVLCIARIGGPEAIVDLEQALRSERNKDVRKIIKFNLSEMRSN